VAYPQLTLFLLTIKDKNLEKILASSPKRGQTSGLFPTYENNPLVFFDFPQSTERRFLIASLEIAWLFFS